VDERCHDLAVEPVAAGRQQVRAEFGDDPVVAALLQNYSPRSLSQRGEGVGA
jgi:hypothetical protein